MSKCIAATKGQPQATRLTVIILAAGIGRRMKGYGSKSLLKTVRDIPLLEYQTKLIWKMYPNAEIIVVTGFQSNKIRSLFRGVLPIRIIYNPEFETKNVMYSLSLALENSLPGNFLILHGDIFFNQSTIVDIVGNISKILVLPAKHKCDEQGVGAIVQDNTVTNLAYGLEREWGQMAFFTGKEAKLLERIAFNRDQSSNWFFYEGINAIINTHGEFSAHSPNTTSVIEINSDADLLRIQRNIIV